MQDDGLIMFYDSRDATKMQVQLVPRKVAALAQDEKHYET